MALTDNLVAYYKLDSNSNDSVNSLNGTDTNISYATAGIIGNGATFNGTDSRIAIADNALLDITGDLTISCWAKTSSIVNNMTMVNKGSGGTTNVPYEFRFNSDASTTGKIILLRAGSSDYGFAVTDARAVTNATMTHLAVTASGTTITFYVNGSPVSSTVARAIPAPTANALSTELGSRNSNLYFNGLMDEVGLWSRALSGTEISELYNSGSGLSYPFVTSIENPAFLLNFI